MDNQRSKFEHMKNLIYILMLFPLTSAICQGVMISGGYTNVSSSAHITIVGSGNLSNNGSMTLDDGSWVHFAGTTQEIRGNSNIDFDNIEANATTVNIARDINIRTALLLSCGLFDLKDANVKLSSTAMINGGETNTKRIRATNVSNIEGQGDGKIQITVSNPSGNVANLGVDFTPISNLGSTTIIRGHKELQGTGSFSGNSSIYRYYDIRPTTQANLLVNNFYFFPDELGSQASNADNLVLFQMINSGAGDDYWHPQITTVHPTYASSEVTTNHRPSFMITLGSKNLPLPIELLTFTAQCKDDGVDVKWQTVTEINADYFSLERSTNGVDFEPFAQVSAQGNSNNLTNYSIKDAMASNLNYYLIKQYDFDGKSYIYGPISVVCDAEEEEDIIPIYSMDGRVFFEINGKSNHSYKLTITNAIGQLIATKDILTNMGHEKFDLDPWVIAKGMYMVTLSSSESRISKQFIIHQ